ncbi:hypothetical protein W97_08947 [Coniosporium apollinis CBS 100218]|uniref:Cytochrome P450 n=1 Tax=Coniosporium apollinis (strain CBS 100218) TaxID=1168221 RepID=R7Z698_CONA1|nr:uncharacterized protein W97_08947 [Coniosporium apollinis CBS 100218]EON69687.1 hypothetical protein W97_08947 [Coniosporium apollinis CBS 100218]
MSVKSLRDFPSPSPGHVILAAGVCLLSYMLLVLFYRLHLSPLAAYPGPKLAAATHLCEFYYDVVRRGQFVFKLREWHSRYGPIVRINPDEIHIYDSDHLLSSVFTTSSGKRREKYEVATRVFGAPQAAIATVDHDMHRMRRGAMGRFFSKENVRRVEPIIQTMLQQMFARMREYQQTGRPLTVSLLYSAFTADIITEYAFAKPNHYLDMPDLNKKFFNMMVGVHEMGAMARYFKRLLPVLNSVPPWLVTKLNPGMREFFVFQEEMKERIREVKGKSDFYEKLAHRTVFHEILNSNIPVSEKTVDRLWQEAEIVSVAGTETTAWTLAVITFYLLANPEILRTLRTELFTITEKSVAWKQLEKLPYLTAVIQEGLRLSFGVTSRLVRTCPDETVRYETDGKVWEIPSGTPISTTGPLYHLDPSIFPDPLRFHPERWLEDGQSLDRYLWSFSKGSRQCLGMNLAYAELYLCLFAVFRKYAGPGNQGSRMELFDTSTEDVEFKYDLFVPYPKIESEGIRVVLKDD